LVGSGHFAECRENYTRQSDHLPTICTQQRIFKKNNFFIECLQAVHSAKNFQKKKSRVPPGWTLGKEFSKRKLISLPSASRQDTRQRIFKKTVNFFAECLRVEHSAKNFGKKISLPSAFSKDT